MTVLKEALDDLSITETISSRVNRFRLKWISAGAGFDIFRIQDVRGGKTSLGDDADYLHLFMIMAERVLQHDPVFKPLLIASDAGGNHLFLKYFTPAERVAYRYAYIALGQAAKQLPEDEGYGQLSFFAEITLENTDGEGFEKEARKAARTMSEDVRNAWNSVIENKNDFLKTDLYIFHLLKLYSWGFQIITPGSDTPATCHFVRAERPKPRGSSRH